MKALLRPFILSLALLSFAAPTALAVDDPNCDTQGKSTAQLQQMLASPTTAQYCAPGTVDEVEAALGERDEASEVAGRKDETPPTAGDVAPAREAAPARETADVASADNLPFTGAEMGTFVVLGAILILTGLVLRRGGRTTEHV